MDGGAGLVHGVTDSNLFSLIMQITEFDDQVWLDGVPCPSCSLITLPPETHFLPLFAPVPTSGCHAVVPKDDALAQRLQPPARSLHAFKTEKHMMMLSTKAASAFRAVADDVFGKDIECAPSAGIEEAMCTVMSRRPGRTTTASSPSPARQQRSSEQIVFRALRYVQSRGDENVEIGDLARVTNVNYRTLLRAFERYLKISPKRYLKTSADKCRVSCDPRERRTAFACEIFSLQMACPEFGRFCRRIQGWSSTNCRQPLHQRQASTIATGAAVSGNSPAGPYVLHS